MIWVLVTIDGDLKNELVEIDVDFHTLTRYIYRTWLRSWHIWRGKIYGGFLVKGSCSLWLQSTCKPFINPSISSKDLKSKWWSFFSIWSCHNWLRWICVLQVHSQLINNMHSSPIAWFHNACGIKKLPTRRQLKSRY